MNTNKHKREQINKLTQLTTHETNIWKRMETHEQQIQANETEMKANENKWKQVETHGNKWTN